MRDGAQLPLSFSRIQAGTVGPWRPGRMLTVCLSHDLLRAYAQTWLPEDFVARRSSGGFVFSPHRAEFRIRLRWLSRNLKLYQTGFCLKPCGGGSLSCQMLDGF